MDLLRFNEFIMPIIVLLIGGWYKVHPEQYKINNSNGYSTKMSRHSKEAWDYAQELFSREFIKCGMITLTIVLLLNICDIMIKLPYRESIIYTIEVVMLCLVFIKSEYKIKEEFKIGN